MQLNLINRKRELSAATPARASIVSKSWYEAKVCWQALRRAGGNPYLKGHIHELLVRDKFNANPLRLIDRKSALLVKSPTARAVDLIIMKSGKVVHRWQLKDTPGSIRKVVRHIRRGRYSSVQILGTRETVKEFEKAATRVKGLKTIRPSGVSSRYATSLAQRAGAAGAGSIPRAFATAARTGGVWGGIICGSMAFLQSAYGLSRGRVGVKEACTHVVREAGGGAVSGAVAGMAGTSAGVGIAALLGAIGLSGVLATASIVIVPLVPAIVVGAAVKSGWDRLWRRSGK